MTGPGPQGSSYRVGRRNASFQQWVALLTNRAKRASSASFLVHGVRPLDQARLHHWPMRALLHRPGPLSEWAGHYLAEVAAGERVEVADELLAEIGDRPDSLPEIVGVAAIPPDDLSRIQVGRDATARSGAPPLVLIADRPGNPGNLGTLVRTADALGASGVVISGHAADVYEPQAVRSSRGSVFAVPVVRVGRPGEVRAWVADQGMALIGAGEDGATDLWDVDLAGPTAIVVGNEAAGLARSWVEACDVIARIPMEGAASSLNAAVAGSILTYEALRQRRRPGP